MPKLIENVCASRKPLRTDFNEVTSDCVAGECASAFPWHVTSRQEGTGYHAILITVTSNFQKVSCNYQVGEHLGCYRHYDFIPSSRFREWNFT